MIKKLCIKVPVAEPTESVPDFHPSGVGLLPVGEPDLQGCAAHGRVLVTPVPAGGRKTNLWLTIFKIAYKYYYTFALRGPKVRCMYAWLLK